MFDNETPFNILNKLPSSMAIYGVFNTEQLLYIGVSWRLRARFYRHHKMLEFYQNGATVVKWKLYDNEEALYDDEHTAITTLKPKLNILTNRQTTIRPKGRDYSKEYINNILGQCSCSLQRVVLELTWEYVASGKSRQNSIDKLSQMTGLTTGWIDSFLKNPDQSSSVNRIETLYYHLTGGKNILDLFKPVI